MKTVYLFRHGDSEDNGTEEDYSRKLTSDGISQTKMMADYLHNNGVRPDRIISSGALRAVSTAGIIAGSCGYSPSDIAVDDILYSSKTPDDLFPVIRNNSSSVSSIMIVGHNPLLSDFVLLITVSPLDINMKKSSVVRLDFNTSDWKSVSAGTGKIVYYKTLTNSGIIDAVYSPG